jgi:hypothetical protein
LNRLSSEKLPMVMPLFSVTALKTYWATLRVDQTEGWLLKFFARVNIMRHARVRVEDVKAGESRTVTTKADPRLLSLVSMARTASAGGASAKVHIRSRSASRLANLS